MKQQNTSPKSGKSASALGGLMPMIMAHKIKLVSIFLIVVVLPPVMYYYNNNIKTSVRGEAKESLALPTSNASASNDMSSAQIHRNLQKRNNSTKTESDQDLAARLQHAEQQLLGNQAQTNANKKSEPVPVSQPAKSTQNIVAINNNAQSTQTQNTSSLPIQGIDANTNQVQSTSTNEKHSAQATDQLLAATSSKVALSTPSQAVKQTPVPASEPKQIPISKLTLVTPTHPAVTTPKPAVTPAPILVTPTQPATVKTTPKPEVGENAAAKVTPKPVVNKTTTASTPSSRAAMEKQLLNANGKHYTLQLVGVSHPDSLSYFVTANKLNREKVKFYQTKLRGKNWYVLVYGQYPSRTAAMNAIKTLPSNIQKQKPWARSLSSVQKDIKK